MRQEPIDETVDVRLRPISGALIRELGLTRLPKPPAGYQWQRREGHDRFVLVRVGRS